MYICGYVCVRIYRLNFWEHTHICTLLRTYMYVYYYVKCTCAYTEFKTICITSFSSLVMFACFFL